MGPGLLCCSLAASYLATATRMTRLDHLFGLGTLLQARRCTPAEHIARHFGLSVRTVYRGIRALGKRGSPVSFEAGRGYL